MRNYIVSLLIIIFLLMPLKGYTATYNIEGDLIGRITHYTVKRNDTLYDIARKYDLGIVELMAANPGVDDWMPTTGKTLTLPTAHILPLPHEGIVINIAELRLYYFINATTVMTFPVGIGKEGWATPTGTTRITKKRKDPSWIPPASIREETPDLPDIVPPGPDNPMGNYALYLGWNNFAIHGTNRPYGVGRHSSHGCIRLYPEDISVLFDHVNAGTKVTVINTPYKTGWYANNLLLEISSDIEQSSEMNEPTIAQSYAMINDVENEIIRKSPEELRIFWRIVYTAIKKHSGLPVVIGQKKDNE